MTEGTNTQLIRQTYEHISAGNIQAFLSLLAGDVEWHVPEMGGVPFSGKWRGREEVRRFFDIVADVQEVIEFVPEEFIAQANQVVVLGRFAWHIRATGKTSRARWAHVWTVSGNQVARFREYTDTAAVISAHSNDLHHTV